MAAVSFTEPQTLSSDRDFTFFSSTFLGYPTPTAIVCKLVPGDKAVDVQLSWKVLEGNTTVPSSRFYVDVCRDGQCDTFPVFKGHELTLKGLQFWTLYNLTVYYLNRETGGANLEIYTGPGGKRGRRRHFFF